MRGLRSHIRFISFGLLFTLLVAWQPSATAAAILRNVYLVSADQIFRTSIDNAGNEGMEFAFEVAVDPFFVQAGDRITTRVFFDQPLLIRNDPGGFWSFPGTATSWEQFFFEYNYADGPSGIGSVSEATTQFTMTLNVLAGNVFAETQSGAVTTGGGGMSVAYFLTRDWTQAAFLLSGLEIVTDVLSYELQRNTGEFHRLEGSILAGNISVLPITEPSTLALLGLGLAGLAFSRRRKQ